MMVIKYTKLYDPRAYGSVSILSTRPGQTDRRTDGRTDGPQTDGRRYTIIRDGRIKIEALSVNCEKQSTYC
jgi:hypothetical protein